MLHKSGKPTDELNSNRPISLLPAFDNYLRGASWEESRVTRGPKRYPYQLNAQKYLGVTLDKRLRFQQGQNL